MAISVRILNGNRKDEEFKLHAGASIGRKQADLKVKDPKMSATHAKIDERGGSFYLVDCGSRNRIIVGDKVVEELELFDGLNFTLGETHFKVKIDSPREAAKSFLLETMKTLEALSSNQDKPIYPFTNKVQLHFLCGPDAGKNMPLGYGPRNAGKDSLDILLQEHYEKTDFFRIEEFNGDLLLHTENYDKITIDGEKAKKENTISNDSLIEFANTKIQVEIF